MRIIEGLDRREVCGEAILVPVGENAADFSKLISLNDSSLFLWKEMEGKDFTADDLVKALLEEYAVDEETARRDVNKFLKQLIAEKLIK